LDQPYKHMIPGF